MLNYEKHYLRITMQSTFKLNTCVKGIETSINVQSVSER